MDEKVVSRIIERMKQYNPNLTVIKIVRYGCSYLVFAVYDVANSFREMDPFYLYYPLTKRIRGFCPTSNLCLFGRFQKRGKIIYMDPCCGQAG